VFEGVRIDARLGLGAAWRTWIEQTLAVGPSTSHAAARSSHCAFKNSVHVVFFSRSGAGSSPCSRRTIAIVLYSIGSRRALVLMQESSETVATFQRYRLRLRPRHL
jgi:hypothetical protein